MKITMTPPIRNEFDRAVTCEKYKSRLLDLFGSEAAIEAADRDWHKHKPPVHHFTTYCTIARMEALSDYLPSERKLVSFIHDYSPPS